MRKTIFLPLLVFALLLSACGARPAATEPPAVLDPQPQAVEEPQAQEEAPPAGEAPEPTPLPETGSEGSQAGGGSPEQGGGTGSEAGGQAGDEVEAAQPAGPVVFTIVPGESTVTYEVGETFLGDNRFNVAIGVTPVLNGEVTVDLANPQSSQIGPLTVDISQFASDSGRRDNAIRGRYLESARYPIVTFTPTQIEGLPAAYTPGEQISFQVTGDLTIREVTRPATFDVTVQLVENTLQGQANTEFLMSDFGFGPISIAGMLNTEDLVKITVDFIARS